MNGKLFRPCVSCLDNADKRPVHRPHNPPQLTGVFEIRCQDCRVCMFSETLVKELAVVFCERKGIIPVAYEDILRRNVVHTTLDGVTTAVLFGLNRIYLVSYTHLRAHETVL